MKYINYGSISTRLIIGIMLLLSSGNLTAQKFIRHYDDEFQNIQFVSLAPADFGANSVVVGTVLEEESGTNTDLIFLKISSKGNILYSQRLNMPGSSEIASSIIQTSDGGYAILGGSNLHDPTNYDIMFVKLNSNLAHTTHRIFKNVGHDHGHGIFQTSVGGYVICGFNSPAFTNNAARKMLVMKITAGGSLVWKNMYTNSSAPGGPAYQAAYATTIIELRNGTDIMVGGSHAGANSAQQTVFLKLDGNGAVLWIKEYHGNGGDTEDNSVYSIVQDPSGNIAAVGVGRGYSGQPSFNPDATFFKLDINGNLLAAKYYGTGQTEVALHIISSGNTFFLSGGYTNGSLRDTWFSQVDASGNLLTPVRKIGQPANSELSSGNNIFQVIEIEDEEGLAYHLIKGINYYEYAPGLKRGIYFNTELNATTLSPCHTILPYSTNTITPTIVNRACQASVLNMTFAAVSEEVEMHCLTNNDYCGALPSRVSEGSGSTGILKQDRSTFGLKVFPNPTVHETNIEFDLGEDEVVTTLEVYDVSGNKVKTIVSDKLLSGKNTFTWENSTKGIYLVILNANGIKNHIKTIVQ
ncbi:MAG: T9SS type A sorting domain-containing protein [Bacteroidota bacterium]